MRILAGIVGIGIILFALFCVAGSDFKEMLKLILFLAVCMSTAMCVVALISYAFTGRGIQW